MYDVVQVKIVPLNLQVSERIEENLENLKKSSSIWENIYSISEEIESWSNNSVMELTDSLNNFNDSHKTENRLAKVKACDGDIRYLPHTVVNNCCLT